MHQTAFFRSRVRETFPQGPLVDKVMTCISGKPLSGQQVTLKITNRQYVAFSWIVLSTLFMLEGLTGKLVGYSAAGTFFSTYIAVLICGCYRSLQVTHMHHCVHSAMFRSARRNRLYADMISGVLMVQNFDEYKSDHLGHHRKTVFTTEEDADAAFMLSLGFKPGLTVSQYWLKLITTIVSPKFHLVFLRSRIQSAVIRSGWRTKIWAAGGTTFSIFLTTLDWKLALFVIWLPMFPFYHVSALLQFLTEHAWLTTKGAPKDGSDYQSRCWGRFCGIPRKPGCLNDALWFLHVMFFAVPTRFGCWVSDLPAHDWHHLCGKLRHDSRDWRNAIYLRQRAIDKGDHLGLGGRELWGLRDALNQSFSGLSEISLIEEAGIDRNTKNVNFSKL